MQTILERATIHDALRLAGASANAHGFFRCFSHDDSNPSAHVLGDTGFRCHACGAKGGILDLLVAAGVAADRAEAARALERFLGVQSDSPPNTRKGLAHAPPPKVESVDDRLKLNYLTEVDAGMALARRFSDIIRYCAKARDGGWYVWDGTRWMHDADSATVFNLAEDCTIMIAGSAEDQTDLAERKRLLDFAISLRRVRVLKNMVEVASKHPKIAIAEPDEFDADAWLFNAANGTINLKNGTRRQPDRDDLITKISEVPYQYDAQCPRWERFLTEIFGGDAETISFVQRAVGYSLTGSNSEQCIFVLHGSGANGKSTFMGILEKLLGDYGQAAEPATFLEREVGGPRNDLAALRGARFVSAIETSQRSNMAEALIKALTGGDKISARFLFKEGFQFEPKFKIWLATNHKPIIRGTDLGIWRRIRLIPFDQRFEGDRDDRALRSKLEAELPGILAWAVEGCLNWQERGLGSSESVAKATASYRTEMDTLAAYLDERCHQAQGARVGASELYRDYRAWAESNGEKPMSQKWFGLRLAERGFTPKRNERQRSWTGISLA
jgi:putative DNA primase/helicase